jgi:ABC-type glycerol-3-phosphate transport system substrate-binding protein
MAGFNWSRRRVMQAFAAAPAILGSAARAAGTIQMVSHRYPALEYYAEKMRNALPGVTVNTQLMPFDKALELITIAFSSKADTIDIVYASDATFLTFAKNGWLRPIDDLWEKYKAEFKLDDFPDSVLNTYRYNGKLYLMPHTLNVMLFFYRKDLLDQAGKAPPKTMAEYRALAKSFNSPMRAGTISCLKPVDAGLNEAHWYMNTIGAGWFDDKWHPVFNDARGVQAVEAMKEITQYAQQGFTAAANDECMIALQQDTAAMGLQWATRAKAMDDPNKSRVVGKIDWEPPPDGHARSSSDGYAISAFSKQDPDTLFRIIATSSDQPNMRGAAPMMVPPRQSLLDDPELKAANRHYAASLASIPTALPFPALPEFYAVGEFITRRVLQAITGEMAVKPALDAAAGETEAFLKGHGYYQ